MTGAPMDYQQLIDRETWGFIHKTQSHYPDETVSFTIDQQRAVYDQMCAAFYAGRPDGVDVQDIAANAVACRLYSPDHKHAIATIVYAHGGGFVVGGLDSHDDVCAEICARTGARVLAVDYRLAPEHAHPAAYDDCITAINWAAAQWDGPIVLAGDSAGGSLMACAAHALRQMPQLRGQLLIYPSLGAGQTASLIAHANAPLLTAADMAFYRTIRTNGAEPPSDDPRFAALADRDFTALPPTILITADCDPLRDDSMIYTQRLQAMGIPVLWVNEAGLVHGYLRARHSAARARASFGRIIRGLSALCNSDPLSQVVA